MQESPPEIIQNIQTGNAVEDSAETRGWFVGSFLDPSLGLRHSEDVEIKWGEHLAGTARDEWVTGETRTASRPYFWNI